MYWTQLVTFVFIRVSILAAFVAAPPLVTGRGITFSLINTITIKIIAWLAGLSLRLELLLTLLLLWSALPTVVA